MLARAEPGLLHMRAFWPEEDLSPTLTSPTCQCPAEGRVNQGTPDGSSQPSCSEEMGWGIPTPHPDAELL